MSAYAKNFSTRLFIQAAFTGLLAPVGSHGSMWLTVTFALAVGAVAVGAVTLRGHDRTRELVMGYEAVAVAVGVVGLLGHHYIPGTIVGVAALITAVNNPMPRAVSPVMAADPTASTPQVAAPAPQFAAAAAPQFAAAPAPQFAAPVPAQPVYAEPAPVEAAPVETAQPEPVVEQPAPALPAYTGVRAMTILPGR